MGKQRRRYEVEFTACLLACGPMPWAANHDIEIARFNDGIGEARQKYQMDVMNWWCNWHNNDTPPRLKSQYRFYKKFRTWQKIYLRKIHDEKIR